MHLSGASTALTAFASALNIPVAHTMTGKGAIPCTNSLSAGLFGRYDRIANGLIEQSDLLVVVGCKLGEIATKRFTVPGPGKCVIHLDILAEEFGRTLGAGTDVAGHARSGIEDLHRALANRATSINERLAPNAAQIPERMAKWRLDVAERLHSEEVPVSMARLMTEINRLLPADGYLVADGGFAAHWSGLLFHRPARTSFRSQSRLRVNRIRTARGDGGCDGSPLGKIVFSLTGHGGFNSMLGEIETARRLALTFTVIVVNNAASGYVKALQHLVYGPGSYHALLTWQRPTMPRRQRFSLHGIASRSRAN